MKKIFLIILVLMFSVVLCACGGSKGGNNGITMPSGERVANDDLSAIFEELRVATNICYTGVREGDIVGEDGSMKPNFSQQADAKLADGKLYMEQDLQVKGEISKSYIYMGNVENTTYAWNSKDGKTWQCYPNGDASPLNGEYLFGDVLYMDDLISWTYDEAQGAYVCEAESHEQTITVVVSDGVIVAIKSQEKAYLMNDDQSRTEYRITQWYLITYGNAKVGELPPVQNAGE